MAPFSKGDKCDQSFKIGTMENRLALLKPLQNENYKTVVSTYASEFPRREVKNAKCQPFIHHPATEISKDSGHFSQLTTETKRQYEEKLSFLKPPVCPDRVKLTSVQMHSDKRISPFYQTSHKLEFPGKLPIKKREICVPSLATGNRVLARDEKQLPIESEQQEKFKGERNKDFDIAEKSDKTKSIRVPIQGDNCKRYQTTNESTFQGKWYPPVSKAASQYYSCVLKSDPEDKTGQSMYNDEFQVFLNPEINRNSNCLLKKTNLQAWSDKQSYKTSSSEEFKPKFGKVERAKPPHPPTHSDLPPGDCDPRRESDRQQYNTYQHFYNKSPSSGLVREHVSGANLRTKSSVEFTESKDWDCSTTHSVMFRQMPITEIPQRHRTQPPCLIPFNYYSDPTGNSTSHSDFKEHLPLKHSQSKQPKRLSFCLNNGKFRDETTQKSAFVPYKVGTRTKIESYRRQFSSVPLGTLKISL